MQFPDQGQKVTVSAIRLSLKIPHPGKVANLNYDILKSIEKKISIVKKEDTHDMTFDKLLQISIIDLYCTFLLFRIGLSNDSLNICGSNLGYNTSFAIY